MSAQTGLKAIAATALALTVTTGAAALLDVASASTPHYSTAHSTARAVRHVAAPKPHLGIGTGLTLRKVHGKAVVVKHHHGRKHHS